MKERIKEEAPDFHFGVKNEEEEAYLYSWWKERLQKPALMLHNANNLAVTLAAQILNIFALMLGCYSCWKWQFLSQKHSSRSSKIKKIEKNKPGHSKRFALQVSKISGQHLCPQVQAHTSPCKFQAQVRRFAPSLCAPERASWLHIITPMKSATLYKAQVWKLPNQCGTSF